MTLTLDEIASFKMIVAMVRATHSIDHEIVRSFCKRKRLTEEQFLDLRGSNGTIRDLVEQPPFHTFNVETMIENLKNTGLVDISTE